ncbi:MAG TPA: DNA repair protein RadC [Bacteroidota bacterium]|nr:DNA repair protein RadC [Bacteroidota bacterium]
MKHAQGVSGGVAQYHSRITDWPPGERPREKLVMRGPEALSDAELLAILLRHGTGDLTAVDVAKAVVAKYRSLGQLSGRGFQEIRNFRGIGLAKAASLVAAFEIGRRVAAADRSSGQPIRSPEDVVRIFQPLLRDKQQEVFMVLLLDSANHLLRDIQVTCGILNSSLVHPREVFRPAIAEPSAGVILLHNHPSGNPDPSGEDIQVTRQLVEAGKIIGIPVHDHIILTGNSFSSFAERGLL